LCLSSFLRLVSGFVDRYISVLLCDIFSQINTKILTQHQLDEVGRIADALPGPSTEGRPPVSPTRVTSTSKGGLKGDQLRRLLSGNMTYAYMFHAPEPVLQLLQLLEVSCNMVQLLFLCLCVSLDVSVMLLAHRILLMLCLPHALLC